MNVALCFEIWLVLFISFIVLVQVENVKRTIEATQGADVYPAALQMLIHQGKVLKDGTTLDENKIAENAFVVIMLSKVKSSFLANSLFIRRQTPDIPSEYSSPLPCFQIQFQLNFSCHDVLFSSHFEIQHQ